MKARTTYRLALGWVVVAGLTFLTIVGLGLGLANFLFLIGTLAFVLTTIGAVVYLMDGPRR